MLVKIAKNYSSAVANHFSSYIYILTQFCFIFLPRVLCNTVLIDKCASLCQGL